MVKKRENAISLRLICRIAICAFCVFFVVEAYAGPKAYIGNEDGGISVIDTSTNQITGVIPINPGSLGINVSHDGSTIYVTNYSYNTVSVIDSGNGTVLKKISVGQGPLGVASNLDGSRLYISNFDAKSISVVDPISGSLLASIPLMSNDQWPSTVAISPDNKRIYVASYNSTYVIDEQTNKILDKIPTPNAYGLVLSPNGQILYVDGAGGTIISGVVYDTLFVIDTSTDKIVRQTYTPYESRGMAVSPDGTTLYITASSGSSELLKYNEAQNTGIAIQPTSTGAGGAAGVSVSPDGKRVYVADDNSGLVSVIDPVTAKVLDEIAVGGNPFSLGRFMGPGNLLADNSGYAGYAGGQVSGNFPPITNKTSCPVTYDLVNQATHGTVVIDSSTGEWTYTPASSRYSGEDSFTWRAQAPSSCTAADNPIDPVSNTAVVTLIYNPLIQGLSSTGITENTSTEENMVLSGSTPITYSISSDNPAILPASSIAVIPSNCGSDAQDLNCLLKLTAASVPGTVGVTVQVQDKSNVTTKDKFLVTVTAGSKSQKSGGGAFDPVYLLLLAGLFYGKKRMSS